MPWRSIQGKARNIGSDGMTYQNVASAWPAMRLMSWVSRHSHRMPKSDTSGRDATKAPKAGLRRAISDTAMTMIPDKRALVTRYSTVSSQGDEFLGKYHQKPWGKPAGWQWGPSGRSSTMSARLAF